MPGDDEKPGYESNVDKYQSNVDRYQSNEEKYQRAEENDVPRERYTDTDYTRTPQGK